jgi:hypothetical protein
MRSRFTRLNFFKKIESLRSTSSKQLYFHTQSWVYKAIVAYFSSIDKIADLEFAAEIINSPVYDYPGPEKIKDDMIYGNVYEGDPSYWFENNWSRSVKIVTGHDIDETRGNVHIIGFDYWDIKTHNDFRDPIWYDEINRSSVIAADYDVMIATGQMRRHRKIFLEILRDCDLGLLVVTDDHQSIYPTDLRFGNLGFEVFLNKLGTDKFSSHAPTESFFDGNQGVCLDHLPHRKMYQSSRVNAILETTAFDTTTPFLTEKTFKCLIHSRPFVLFGDTNSLKKLRGKGFRTFSEFCDESYDTITDTVSRARACVQALAQLVECCRNRPHEIDKICQHNQEVFFSTKRHFDNLARFGKLAIDRLYI